MWINKYSAIVLVLVILLSVYFIFIKGRKESASDKKKSKNGTKSKKKGKKSKSGSSSKSDENIISNDDSDSGNDEDENDDQGDKDVAADAKELYGLVHEGMAHGMQKEEFTELAGDLADNFIFIDLKQLYNQAIDKKIDPLKAITLKDYVRVLTKENSS